MSGDDEAPEMEPARPVRDAVGPTFVPRTERLTERELPQEGAQRGSHHLRCGEAAVRGLEAISGGRRVSGSCLRR